MRRVRVGRAFGGWSEDPLWASFYDWTVEHPLPGGALWRLGLGSDLLEQWLGEEGLTQATLRTSGAIGYVRGVQPD